MPAMPQDEKTTKPATDPLTPPEDWTLARVPGFDDKVVDALIGDHGTFGMIARQVKAAKGSVTVSVSNSDDMKAAGEIFARLDREIPVEEARIDRLLEMYGLR